MKMSIKILEQQKMYVGPINCNNTVKQTEWWTPQLREEINNKKMLEKILKA